jgi:hypothetical protein
LPVGEFLGAPQNGAVAEQRVTVSAAVAVDVLLDMATDLIECGGAKLYDVNGVQHRDRVFRVDRRGVLVAVEEIRGADPIPSRKALLRACSHSA